MKQVLKSIPPFFPRSKFLTDKWWHRLSLVISYIWLGFFGFLGLVLLYFFITTTTTSVIQVQTNISLRQDIQNLLNQQTRSWDYESAYKRGVSYENTLHYLKTYDKSVDSFDPKSIGATEIDSSFIRYDNGTQLNIEYWLLLASLLFLSIGILVPNLLYRVFLFIVTGNKWRNKSKSIN